MLAARGKRYIFAVLLQSPCFPISPPPRDVGSSCGTTTPVPSGPKRQRTNRNRVQSAAAWMVSTYNSAGLSVSLPAGSSQGATGRRMAFCLVRFNRPERHHLASHSLFVWWNVDNKYRVAEVTTRRLAVTASLTACPPTRLLLATSSGLRFACFGMGLAVIAIAVQQCLA